jgi:leader peptidase (prepilin peptidase) / N-methyltransferase
MDQNALLNALLQSMIFFLGAVVGSFLNVVIYRVPLGMSVNNPKRSFCPSCKAQIPWYHNLPLITWIQLGGKCARCPAKIAFRYFFVELLTAVLFYLVYWRLGGPWVQLSEWGPVVMSVWIFFALLIAGTFIDIDHMILPHGITFGGMLAGMLCALWAPALLQQEEHLVGLLASFLSVFLGVGLLWSVVLLGKLMFGRLRYRQRNTPMYGIKRWLGFIASWKWLDKPTRWSITQPDEELPPIFTVMNTADGTVHPWEDIFNSEKDRLALDCTELTINDQVWAHAKMLAKEDHIEVTNAQGQTEQLEWETSTIIHGTATEIIVSREAMGMGDVFFIGMIGAFTGWQGVVFTIFAASFLGVIFAVLPRMIGRAEWTAKIPFGPYLAGGAVLAVFYGTQFWDWYLAMTPFANDAPLPY